MPLQATYSRLILAAAVLLAGLALCAVPAAAESGHLVDFRLGLTSRSPTSPTGLSVSFVVHTGRDRNAKSSPLRSEVLRLPQGLRFDSAAVAQCTATDDEIQALGPDACPADSKLTLGQLVVVTGFGPPFDPFVNDMHVFNGENQIIEIFTVQGSSRSTGVDHLTIDGSTLTAHPPAPPGGPPDGQTAVRSVDLQIPIRVAGGKSLATTPLECPASGRWTSTGTFGFADGRRETVASATPCGRVKLPAGPKVRLAVHPRSTFSGRRVRVRLRVRSTAKRCVSGATVRLGGRRIRTDRRGRAKVTMTFRRPGLHRAKVNKRGCRPAHALVNVRVDVRD
ncbi:MAG TPA: hypothetical protein VF545_11290 [Thermoleophilaceae bacterium]|jgi:hypothetical protein